MENVINNTDEKPIIYFMGLPVVFYMNLIYPVYLLLKFTIKSNNDYNYLHQSKYDQNLNLHV